MNRKNVIHTETHTHKEILFSLGHEKDGNLQFAATWMDTDGIKLSGVSQRKTNTVWYHLNTKF